MIRLFSLILYCAALLFFSLPALAQADLQQFRYNLQSLNQTDISFSPRYKTDQEMFNMRVLDRSQQLIGRVEDIRVDDSGAFAQLISEINRIGRRENTVKNELFEIAFLEHISAFEIPLGVEGIENVSPEALAAIAPAAGGGNLYSLRAMIGADVLSHGGRRVGEVTRVIFDEQGEGIEALVLQEVPGARRYTNIALPFDPDIVEMRSDYGRIEFRIDRAAANIINDFARKNR